MYYSILFPTREQQKQARKAEAPACFKDLNLDKIFLPILKKGKEYDLDSFYYTPLTDIASIRYRQNVMQDLEDLAIRNAFASFSDLVYRLGKDMQNIRKHLNSNDPWNNNYLTQGRMLDYAERYCHAVTELNAKINSMTVNSDGLTGFISYFRFYYCSEAFQKLMRDITHLREQLSTVHYCMLIKNGTVRVKKYEGQEDHSKQILATFEKFRQGDVKNYRHKLSEDPHAEHVEAAILNLVADLYKDIFNELNTFCAHNLYFPDDLILLFSREIQFYIIWLDYTQSIRDCGLPFNYPHICTTGEHLYAKDCYDLALASYTWKRTVTNDFELCTPERIIVITGPNQGGKTTFARMFGQLHYLASLGFCVPGSSSSLFLFDHILTHFGREEDLSSLNGKLQDDLVRLHDLLNMATSQSIIIINEIFSSTTLSDALILSSHMMDAITKLGAPTVIVTFLDELAQHGAETVSMMSTVRDDDLAQRTFKIIRKAPDGLAYAMYIAGKHGLTYEQLNRRLQR